MACVRGLRRAIGIEWWHDHDDVVPAWAGPYLSLEPAARLIHSYETAVVPGLLQTEAYARGVLRVAQGILPEAAISRRVQLLLRRQQILTRLAADDTRGWVRVARTLLERIGPGKLQPGDPMPCAAEVARESGVSVPTARRGYTYLKALGIICYRAGIGYRVSDDRAYNAHQEDVRSADDRLLDALRLAWGTEYEISIVGGTWRGWRLVGRGIPILAPGPYELNAAIREDHLRRLVLSQA